MYHQGIISDIEKAVMLQDTPALLSDNVVVMSKAVYDKLFEERIASELRKSVVEARSLSEKDWLDWDTVAKEVEAEFFADV